MNTNQTNFSENSRRELGAGMLKQAARDLRRFRRAKSTLGQALYIDAYDWVTADEFSWPFSFLNVCQALNLPPETAREELMSDSSLGTFDFLIRRCGRAGRRVCQFFDQLLVNAADDGSAETAFAAQASTTLP